MPSRLFAECARAVFAAVRRFTAYRSTSAVAVAAVALLCAGTAWAASNIIEYTRDAAGNITALARPSASSLAITSFSPASGSVGTVVTIYGSGFSATPSGNAVAFNGTSAAVSASSINSITTSVPSGASTGKISVTVAGTTVSSSADFVVNPANAPTITAFTPASGDAGVSVNVTGTNFDPNAGATTVKLNGVSAGPSVSSTTALSFPVPAGAGSGRITATTSLGTATSADDFIVPPTGVSAADILKKVRIAVDGEITNVSMGTANKHAMLLFDVDTSGYYSIQLSAFETSPTTGTINYKVIAPDNSVLQTGTVGNVSKPSIHLPKLTATGTYSVLLSPGLATLNINARVITNATLTVDGTAGLTAFDWHHVRQL